jgi:rfaE bifunctional protein kinase chain/domain/rfaE bifunctional protein nucleotidyltransferase chain/domain
MIKKIIKLEDLVSKLRLIKKKKKKIVLCHGVFDLLHIGHIRHLNEAKKMGDILIVSVTSDPFVNKGPNRPMFKDYLRLEAIASLKFVDFVVLSKSGSSVDIIKKIKPKFYCKGSEYQNKENDITNKIIDEERLVKRFGGKLVFTNEITFSSSNIINKVSDTLSENQKQIIKKIKVNNNFQKTITNIKSFEKLKVLVIGETIIDQYSFCDPLNKSGKDPMLVLKHNKTEEYLGGAVAIVKNIENFCDKISLLTMLGEKAEYKNKIEKNLSKKTKLEFINKKNSKTITKKRYLDKISNNKLLGVYEINDDNLTKFDEIKLQKKLKKIIPKFDLVVVSDYGHGFLSKNSAKLISKLSKYLALNAQINSSNVGYHTLKNYKNINCLIINEKEIRHEVRNRSSKVEILMKNLAKSQNIMNLVVTKGIKGSVLFNKKQNKFYYCDSFSKSAIDKIGAGDTMLSLISLCLKNKINLDLSLLLSSLAAAQSVRTMGNKKSIDKMTLMKSLEHILK